MLLSPAPTHLSLSHPQAQAQMVSSCDGKQIDRLVAEFKHGLESEFTLQQWAKWMQDLVKWWLKDAAQGSTAAVDARARELLPRWSFVTSIVIRDLTLRSAISFGSFHLILLLFDEYIIYLVELVAAHVRS